MTRKALAALAAISVAGCSAPPNEDPIESREQPIVGGVETPACAWPTTVSFSQNGAGCTATLIHPKMITVADHCLEGNGGTIKLTDSLSGRAPRTIAIQRCIPRPAGVNGGEDFAVCLLAEEVNDVPVIPVLFGCETDILKPGQEVALVGFGFIGENKQNPNGHKRWVMAKINRINSGRKSIDIGDPMHQNCFGDSGGPAFVKLADGTWRVFGVTSTTNSPACASQGTWALTPTYVPWVEQQTNIDITPCHDAATGMWEGGPGCQGFPMNPEVALGTWATGCTENLVRSGPGMTCGAGTDAGPPVRDAQADTGRSDGAGGRGAGGSAGAGGGGRGGSGGSGGGAGAGGGASGSGGNAGGGTAGTGMSGAAGAAGNGAAGTGMAGGAGTSGGAGAGGTRPSTSVTTTGGAGRGADPGNDTPGCGCSFARPLSHGRMAFGLLLVGGLAMRRRQRRRG